MAAEEPETKTETETEDEFDFPPFAPYSLSTTEKETLALTIVHKHMRGLALKLKDQGVTDKKVVAAAFVDFMGKLINTWVRKQTNDLVTELFDSIYKQLVISKLIDGEVEPEAEEEEEFTDIEQSLAELTVVKEEEEE
mmetsp:Transcript_28786/g.73676  ORF Transcript_28786/g.73676 Transcript_28786/m.73676 type:complete len:138 (+) Transcript_28786:6648-7061(+)